MWPLAEIEIKKQVQDRSLLFWTVILPIAFIVFFIEIFTNEESQIPLVATQTITGMSVFFSAFIIISIVISFVKDREKGFVARLASTPLKPSMFLLGKSMPFIIIVIIQMLLLLLLGIFFYDLEVTNYLTYFLFIILLSIMTIAWGVAIALFSRTENTGVVVTQIIAMGTAVICGLWMPYESLPETFQTIGKLFPQYWAHQGLLNSVSQLSSNENIRNAALLLIAYTILGVGLALIGYRKYLKIARN